MNINELIANIRTWQALSDRYTAACEEARQINDGKHYPSSPGRRSAIKALDDHAMELIHDVHNDAVLEMLVTLADEIERLQKRVQSLRITLWETERDANTALKLLKIKNYENVGNLCELIALSVNDTLQIDKERE